VQTHKVFQQKQKEKSVETSKENKIISPTEVETPISNEKSIYVPSINLYVAKQKTLLGKNWNDTTEEIHSKNQKMLTIPEFWEFLKYSKTNFPEIYKEIIEVKDPWRAEWLDANFKVENNKLFVYYFTFENNKIVSKKQQLDSDTLMSDKTPGIDLEKLLIESTAQGLPKKNIISGSLYYWYPRSDNNSVAYFVASSSRACLGCNWSPSGRDSSLGVRVAQQLEVTECSQNLVEQEGVN